MEQLVILGPQPMLTTQLSTVLKFQFIEISFLVIYITQEGEPRKEGGWAEAEQWQQQDDQVEGNGVGFTPPVFKRVDISIISTVANVECADSRVSFRVSVRVWTDDWETNQQIIIFGQSVNCLKSFFIPKWDFENY